ncbi:MAG: TIGR04086 family membrane protein [Ruminococcus sp.]|nr:TIGR04086 family membrane protein [Ruminococcus sp.]
MRKYSRSLWEKALPGLAVSSLFGSLCGMVLAMLFSVFVYLFMDNTKFIGVLATAAIVLSGFSGAFLCGKYRRKHGIAEGTLCGIIIFALITVISVVITDNIPDLKKLVLLALSGAVGGVCGVNSKRPDKLMN